LAQKAVRRQFATTRAQGTFRRLVGTIVKLPRFVGSSGLLRHEFRGLEGRSNKSASGVDRVSQPLQRKGFAMRVANPVDGLKSSSKEGDCTPAGTAVKALSAVVDSGPIRGAVLAGSFATKTVGRA
jgi:hypothetical protein